jgi:hypothetical protein
VNAFNFITNEWLDLHTWMTKVRSLPRTPAEFTSTYGAFEDAADANSTESALISAAEAADLLGSAAEVKQAIANDGSYLTSPTTPKMLYGALVWWALQVENTATTVDTTMSMLATVLEGAHATPDDVRALLTDPQSGLTATLDKTSAAGRDLATQFGNLKDRVLPQIQVFAGTKMVSEANQALGALSSKLKDLHEQAAKDYLAWKHEVLGPGDPPPAIDASNNEGGFSLFSLPFRKGKERAAKADYERVVVEFASLRETEAQKARFVADVRGLDVAGTSVAPALGDLAAGVTRIVDTLDNLATRCRSVATSASDEQLTEHNWLTTALAPEDVISLGSDAQEFVRQALVETHVPPPTGESG